MPVNRFQGGRALSTFKCECCGKQTRETGENESELRLCKKCLFEAYVENAANDYGVNSAEHKDALARLATLKPKSSTTAKGTATMQSKNATVSGKQIVRNMLTSGKPVTVEQLVKATKRTRATVVTYLYDLRSKKYAGGKVLKVRRTDDGKYFA